MSDVVTLTELLAVANDDSLHTPPLPLPLERKTLRLAADLQLAEVAVAVGTSTTTLWRCESREPTMPAGQTRKYRRVLGFLRERLEQRDPCLMEGK